MKTMRYVSFGLMALLLSPGRSAAEEGEELLDAPTQKATAEAKEGEEISDSLPERLTLGGYGEVHLNAVFPDVNGDTRPAPVVDFHRYVLLFGYQFNNQWSMVSELELEHNWVQGGSSISEDETGYLVLEQAYLQYDLLPELTLRGGVLLLPVGLINEHHEPNQFNTVERPRYHNQIVPTTWFGTGVAVGGDLFGGILRYDLLVTEGLDDRKFTQKDAIRSGRQKGFYASLDNLLTTVRIDYIGFPGFVAGGSVAINWNLSDRDDENPHIYERMILAELHLAYSGQGFRTSAEFTDISYAPKAGVEVELKRSQGITAEFGYDVLRPLHTKEAALYPFVRFSRLNPAGSLKLETAAYNHLDAGLSFLPIRKVAIKADYGRRFYRDSARNVSFVNVGLGYAF